MTEIIKAHNGSVNQFVGDEIFAAFGAPISSTNNEVNAAICGIKMMENLVNINEKFKVKFNREIIIGIGINCGEVVAGNLGSEDRIDYSLTGDTVNTGKRIESLTKDKPNAILISDGIYEKTKDILKTKAWEPINVKGKKEKIMVYEIIGRIS